MAHTFYGRRRRTTALCALSGWAATAVFAGGSAERTVLIVDPADPDALAIANAYVAARDFPPSHVLYFAPGAPDLAQFAAENWVALQAALAERDLADEIDAVVIADGPFYLDAPGLITDSCSPVNRVSLSSAYTIGFLADDILAGDFPSGSANRYYGTNNTPVAFDGSIEWLNGAPGSGFGVHRYYLGALLGYTGPRGNTVDEVLAMITRSAGVDGAQPVGTTYYMRTDDLPRSGPRHNSYPSAVLAIHSVGGQAEEWNGVLPTGRHNCMGIMTGIAIPGVPDADLTLLPGAFCDHLTSYAATFNTNSQEKCSRWIAKGASGTHGTVEEPCNYAGKFPHARMHVYYRQGMALGESFFRSHAYVPLQGLLLGDPLTQPYARRPTVSVTGVPANATASNFTVRPTVTNAPTGVAELELLIDGVVAQRAGAGGQFAVNPRSYADGWHDLRVVARAAGGVAARGRWRGGFTVNALGRSVALTPARTTGNLSTRFDFTVNAAGGGVREVRLLQNGRVLAAQDAAAGTLATYGFSLGGETARVQAEALYADGMRVRSAPRTIVVSRQTGSTSSAPTAVTYTKLVDPGAATLVELPYVGAASPDQVAVTVITDPARGTLNFRDAGPFVLYTPDSSATCGSDVIEFSASVAGGPVSTATVRLDFGACVGDLNCDGRLSVNDITPFVLAITDELLYAAEFPDCDITLADVNADGDVTISDVAPFVAELTDL